MIYPLLFGVLLIIAFRANFSDGKVKYGGEFWSDRGGYYIYLPATFIYGYHISSYPESIDVKNGGGFQLDKKSQKVFTKYPSGVSLMILPFFLPTHFIAEQFDLQPDGFSIVYHRMAVVAGVFYVVLSLFILKVFLTYYFPRWISYLVPVLILLSTNFYAYGMDHVVLSHLYSFFLASLLLLVTKVYLTRQMKSFGLFILICLILAVSVLIRPTNVLLVSVLFFWDVGSWHEIKQRFRHFFRIRYIVVFLLAIVLVFLPQSFYWHFVSGKWIFYSYTGEGFHFWYRPMLIPFWFAPLNGLFPYTPFFLLFLAGMMIMIFLKKRTGIFLLGLFLVCSYLFSSWSCWYYGGCFGSRPMIDFYPLFAVAAGYCIQFILAQKKLYLTSFLVLFLGLTMDFNLKLFYGRYFYCGGTWSWEDYRDHLKIAGIVEFPRRNYTYKNDFENVSIDFGIPHTFTRVHSGTRSTFLIESMEKSCLHTRQLNRILDTKRVNNVVGSIWINPLDTNKTGAFVVCEITDEKGNHLFRESIPVDDRLEGENRWAQVTFSLKIPERIDMEKIISFYIYNVGKTRFYVDDMVIKFD